MGFEPWWPIIVAVGAVLLALFLLYVTKPEREEEEEPSEPLKAAEAGQALPPLKIERTVSRDEVEKAREELKLMDLEREILSYAIQRLYEAEAEGKITEKDRESLSQRYKQRMMDIKEKISHNESMVALHELEAMQEDLMKLFSDRFDELNKKIGELRTRLEVEPKEEALLPPSAPEAPSAPPPKRERKKKEAPPAPKKTEAEKRIEGIMAEVEKVLERLEQIEVET